MLRVVLDTNILVSASLTPEGIPATILDLGLLSEFVIVISPAVLDEYRDVLARPKFDRAGARIANLLDGVVSVAQCVFPTEKADAASDHCDGAAVKR